VQVSS